MLGHIICSQHASWSDWHRLRGSCCVVSGTVDRDDRDPDRPASSSRDQPTEVRGRPQQPADRPAVDLELREVTRSLSVASKRIEAVDRERRLLASRSATPGGIVSMPRPSSPIRTKAEAVFSVSVHVRRSPSSYGSTRSETSPRVRVALHPAPEALSSSAELSQHALGGAAGSTGPKSISAAGALGTSEAAASNTARLMPEAYAQLTMTPPSAPGLGTRTFRRCLGHPRAQMELSRGAWWAAPPARGRSGSARRAGEHGLSPNDGVRDARRDLYAQRRRGAFAPRVGSDGSARWYFVARVR